VEPLRDELLARSMLAGDQQRSRRRPDPPHQFENRLHLRRLGDHLREMIAPQQPVSLSQAASHGASARPNSIWVVRMDIRQRVVHGFST